MAKRKAAKAGANQKTAKRVSSKKPSTRTTPRKRASGRYEWLAGEIAEAREKKFFVADGPADRKLRQAIQRTTLSAPRSYKEFALQFGNCKLYRQDDYIDRYHVEVFASMHEVVSHDNVDLLWIGAYRGHKAYFKADLLSGDKESPVFEWIASHHSYLQQAAGGFEEWIQMRCGQARKKYLKGRLAEVLRGPPPFTDDEQRIVDARKQFQWRTVGVAKTRKVRFEVHNGSDIVLPYLSIGITTKDSRLDGGATLPVSGVRPGQTRIIEFDCYKSLVPPEDIVAFDYPAPGPEDRGRYSEFSPLK